MDIFFDALRIWLEDMGLTTAYLLTISFLFVAVVALITREIMTWLVRSRSVLKTLKKQLQHMEQIEGEISEVQAEIRNLKGVISALTLSLERDAQRKTPTTKTSKFETNKETVVHQTKRPPEPTP
ncbi:MAG: hypothetical protein COT74_02635 [Bdellovibrionales bacterium CG10_big_fil_rev_8_21_14_0_10_45_34]|nr:MAG: hypothetical protein COT74_02635 [Bdellovibrionales bacterium CG10_big_fil_rev_8_21_14_0_10_45_34]